MVGLFSKKQLQRKGGKPLESTTMRGLGGGLNAVDDDISMAPKYQVSLVNYFRTSSGTQAVRWGSRFDFDIKGVRNSPIVDGTYFNNRHIVVTESGNILSITEQGVITEIWNTAIAAALPGAPSAWTAGVEQVTFVPFKDELVIHNGQDKPVSINSSFAVTYLQDLGSGSNVNVPIGKYGCVAANFHCVAGISGSPTEVFISAEGVAGTFVGDPDPNNAISIDVGAYAPEGGASIRGIAGFRTYLFVHLQTITVQVQLGLFTGDDHVPEFPDTFPQFGLLGQRAVTTVVNDFFTGGIVGLANMKRNVYNPQAVDADYLSELISPVYRRMIGALDDEEMLVDTFVVYDRLANTLMLVLPNGEAVAYTYNDKLRYNAWSTFTGLNFRAGWSSLLGRVYFATGTKVFQRGNGTFEGEDYRSDLQLDRDATWAATTSYDVDDMIFDDVTDESYVCQASHVSGSGTFAQDREDNPGFWERYEGEAISFELEMPWIDGKDPNKVKHLKFLTLGTKGSGEFTVEIYVDNFYKDEDEVIIYDPAIALEFVGNDAPGFGIDAGPYGGGRRSGSANLYNSPVKFKKIKFKIVGSTRRKLEIANLSFLFGRGGFYR